MKWLLIRYRFKGLFSDFSYNAQSSLDTFKNIISMITLSMLLERQRRKKIVVIAGDFNVHEGKNAEDHDDQHESCG